MKKFVFSLENTLQYRQRLEEQEIELLARSKQKVQAEEVLSHQLQLEKQNHLQADDGQEISIVSMQQQAVYLEGLDFRIQNQLQQLDQAKRAFSSQRVQVIKAATKRKTLEQLKGKHLAEYQTMLSQAEQKVLDEIGITAYNRKAEQY